MARNKPYPVSGLRPIDGTLTVNDGFLGMGRYLGGDIGPHGHRTPGLVGPCDEPSTSGTTYYVADSGSDSNSGTSKSSPLATFATLSDGGVNAVSSGDKIVILEEGVTISNDSNHFQPGSGKITVCGEDGTFPTVKITYTQSTPAMVCYGLTDMVFRGFHLEGPNTVVGGTDDGASSYGIRFENNNQGGSWPVDVETAKAGGYCYNVRVTHMGNSGIMYGGTGVGGVAEHCHCAYNYGPSGTGGNADGIQMTGAPDEVKIGGYVISCLLNHNSDDNFDGFRLRGGVVRDTVSIAAGYREDGSTTGIDVPGKGIKIGGSDDVDIGGSIAQRCVSIGCGGAGIGANGSNLPVDFIYCTAFFNARKSSRDYENDYELFEYSPAGPSGFNLQDSRVVGCIGEKGLYVSLEDGVIDSTNVRTCNFDDNNNFDPAFSQIPFASTDVDGDTYPINENTLARLDTREDAASLPKIIDNGSTLYQSTPASQYHGLESVVDYVGDAPDLGAYESTTTTSTTTTTSDSTTGENVKDYGAVGDGSTDDTQAIRDAADAAGPDGTVYFPAGTYLVGSNGRFPLDYPMTGAWDNLTWQGEDHATTQLKMAGGHDNFHMMFRADSGGGYQIPDVEFRQLDFNMNGANNSNNGGSIWFRVYDGAGVVTMRDCIVRDNMNGGLQTDDDMAADVQYCRFVDCGDPDVSAGHALNPNPDSQQSFTFANLRIINSAGTDIDVGRDTDNSYATVLVENCYITAGLGAIKLSTENSKTTVRNTYMEDGGRTTRMIKSNSPDPYVAGDLELDNIEIDGAGGPGIDLAADSGHGTVTLAQVAMRDVEKDELKTFNGTGIGFYAQGSDIAADTATISVYNVAQDNDGDAVFFDPDCTGTLDQVNHSGTSDLGTTNSVTVNTNNVGGPEVTPDVPSTSEVGPRSP